MTRTLRCTVQYEGTAFAGFQKQPGRTTVQGALEDAIERVTGDSVPVFGAGRTDAGVHALGQVIHFATASSLPPSTLQRAVNACLPRQVAVLDMAEAEEGFHARYSARSREYRYVVENTPVPSPLCRQRVHHVAQPLSLEAMSAAVSALEGRHDFAAFGSPMEHSPREGDGGPQIAIAGSTARTMLAARCWRQRRFVLFCFIADAFLRHMVRMLVGTLVRIGTGSLLVTAVANLLHGDRSIQAGPAAPAHGLYLVRVRY